MLVARELLASWRVWWEEYLGLNGSILDHVACKLLQSSPFSVKQFWSSPCVYVLKFLVFALGFKVSKTHYCICTRNGEMIDDIKLHGSHDIFWCFKYERKISSYLDIKTNQKSNEVTYFTSHSRVAFTTIYKQLQVDEDGLFPPQCVIHDLHQYFMTSTQIWPNWRWFYFNHFSYEKHYMYIFTFLFRFLQKKIWFAFLSR